MASVGARRAAPVDHRRRVGITGRWMGRSGGRRSRLARATASYACTDRARDVNRRIDPKK